MRGVLTLPRHYRALDSFLLRWLLAFAALVALVGCAPASFETEADYLEARSTQLGATQSLTEAGGLFDKKPCKWFFFETSPSGWLAELTWIPSEGVRVLADGDKTRGYNGPSLKDAAEAHGARFATTPALAPPPVVPDWPRIVLVTYLLGAIGASFRWGWKPVAAVTFIALFFIAVTGPLAWVLASSLKSASEIATDPWALPTSLHWENYANAWSGASTNLGRAFFNSLFVAVASMAILIPISAMAAYVLAKFAFPGSKAIYTSFLAGMMFPQFLVIVPLYLTMVDLNLSDTFTGLILVYIAFSLPFTVFVLTGFFHNLPDELGEAAMLDGCGHAKTFWRVMLPLARPGLVVVTIFNLIGLWNEYNLALVLVTSEERFTLPLALAKLSNTAQYTSDWGAMFAAIVITMGPVLLVYWLLKEKIQEAMLAGAVKG